MNEPLKIGDPRDAIAAVPYLLGFHPADSLVCLAFGGPRTACAVRQDLPDVDEQTAPVLARNGFEQAIVLGYGPPDRTDDAAHALAAALDRHGVKVIDILRVLGDRWWRLGCPDETCCPPSGRPIDTRAARVTAEAVYAGHVALADRADLARTIAPVTGQAAAAMRAATRRAEDRLAALARGPSATGPPSTPTLLTAEGIPFVTCLLERFRTDRTPPTDDDTAWLGLLLTSLPVRDEAWKHANDAPADHLHLWCDTTRRIAPHYTAAPASLLAYTAYLVGNGALANLALDRALTAAPSYSMAALLREIIALGVPPSDTQARLARHF
ncbi:hypothetical protein BTM25_48590 [Actinomadura rubteroloni]|uniref:DUF4192 domain-containing protein n=1 Tax=Actinomadura rubteroloni TaxID=1926885 RepID=A0A2P4UC82_9ACTN|nr:DUF4192 domain-containing protein [Actinomadura rubteroloni]POM22655.1 hypothetical protein BTM25_48590 [Actinomadura rubteroloni]